MEQLPHQRQSQWDSFKVAFRGLKFLMFHERNFRIHLVIGLLAILACVFFNVTKAEWIYVILLTGMVLAAEATNTCIERICDLVSPGFHPLVGKIKDMAAGMVLLLAIIAVIVGCVIFIPYLISYFTCR